MKSEFIKFHQLPKELKLAVTSPDAMRKLDDLETQFHVTLADVVVRLMVKEISIRQLEGYLLDTLHLPEDKAKGLVAELRNGMLLPVLPYLESVTDVPPEKKTEAPIPSAVPQQTTAPTRFQTPPLPVVAQKAPPIKAPVTQQVTQAPQLPKIPEAQLAPKLGQKAPYYISAEDEEEIAKHRDQLDRMGGASPTSQIDGQIEGIISHNAVTFANDVLAKRLRGLLLSRIRDVRTSDELRELLGRPEKIGGMGYESTIVDHLAKDTDDAASALHDRVLAARFVNPKPVPPPALRSTLAARPAPVVAAMQASQPVTPVKPIPPPPPPPVAKPFIVPPQVQQQIRRQAQAPAPGPRVIQDIKRRQKPVSLVDELAQLTLDDFRSLGRDLSETVAKIVEKVQLLAEDSYEKMAEGVSAWRRSEVQQVYLAMGRESMSGNKSIEEVMADRRRQELPYLTMKEFEAIADLNQQLSP